MAGSGWQKGVALVNAQRQAQGRPLVVDQGDHFHALRGGGVGLRKAEMQARKAFAAGGGGGAKRWRSANRQGQKQTGPAVRARHAWKKAEKAMDNWQERNGLWQQTKEALQPVHADRRVEHAPAGGSGAGRNLAAVARRRFRQDQTATAQTGDAELPGPRAATARGPAVPGGSEAGGGASGRVGGADRKPFRARARQAAARRGILLLCAVVLGKAGAVGQQAVAAVAGHFPPGLSGEQPGGVHQQRAAHAPGRPPSDDARPVGSETAVLELPQVQQWSPPQHHALRTSGRSCAGRPYAGGTCSN